MKSKNSIQYLKISLIALITLFTAEALAAEPPNPDENTKTIAAPGPSTPGSDNSASATVSADGTAKKSKSSPYYAKVGDMYVTWVDYEYEYSNRARDKFYHAKPSESAVALFQRQIGESLVTNAMLVLEAKRRKLKPDNEFVKQQIALYEQRFAQDPRWSEARPRVLPLITVRVQNENLRSQLEKLVRNVHAPSTKQLRQYYAAHPEKFTSPPQQRVSVILLRMDPGAPDTDWQKATEEAQDLVKRVRDGEDFAELARQYSGDQTAEEGGDMGYLHEGMLPGLPAEIVSKLQPGETSDPVTLMEGVSIFRLAERKPSVLNSFEAVKPRATELWLAEQRDNAWNTLIAKLKKNTHVEVDESHFAPLPAATEKPAASTAEEVKP